MANEDEFYAALGRAIQAYAKLEQSLCRLFAIFAETTGDVAGIIFFKITSSNVRDVILTKLLRNKHGDTYSVFWNSLAHLIRQISATRNEIVHWNAARVFLDDSNSFSELRLVTPNFWDLDSSSPYHELGGLVDFTQKCDFAAHVSIRFGLMLNPNFFSATIHQALPPPWRDIFRQEVVYPPPSNHPLYLNVKAPGSQPPPSPGSPQS